MLLDYAGINKYNKIFVEIKELKIKFKVASIVNLIIY